MARTARSAATERAYLQFGRGVADDPPESGADVEFDESDVVWGSFAPDLGTAMPQPLRARPAPAPAGRKAAKPAAAAHGSLPVNIPDWSKILGDEYDRGRYNAAAAADWEPDDADDEDGEAVVPPHELAWRRRAASLSVHQGAGAVGRTLKVRDAVWKRTTGFQD